MEQSTKQVILIVEDSDDDYESTVRALQRSGNLKNRILRCESGDEALDYLYGQGKFTDRVEFPMPSVILLDLNMPGTDGRMVLRKIKNDDSVKDIPVVVLTTSNDAKDIDECYKDGANTYIHKPVDLDGFFKAIKQLKEYWFEIAILPKQK
ncbi:MAG: response regulator [Kangiellaceae bacterium]|jgi:two-component system, response regulator